MTKITSRAALRVAMDAVKFAAGEMPKAQTEWTFEEVLEKLEAMDAALAKKSATRGKSAAKEAEQEAVKAEILAHTDTTGKRAMTIAQEMGISGQRVAALARQLITEGKMVKREGEKGVVLFALAGEPTD